MLPTASCWLSFALCLNSGNWKFKHHCRLCVLLLLQLRQQAVAVQKAAAASEGVQDELRRQLDQARQQGKELQKQLDVRMESSSAMLAQAQQLQQELQQQLADVTQQHEQVAQQHRCVCVGGGRVTVWLSILSGPCLQSLLGMQSNRCYLCVLGWHTYF